MALEDPDSVEGSPEDGEGSREDGEGPRREDGESPSREGPSGESTGETGDLERLLRECGDSILSRGFHELTAHVEALSQPEWIGRYRIVHLLGAGGMGLIYLAEQREPIRRKVAIKLIKVGMDTREVIARFEAERQALALMDHPGIATVHDAGATEEGRPYFVMEYVPGVPITDHCDRKRLGLVERLRLFQQVCEAVQHAHQKGIIHRDLKPANILVMEQDDKAMPKIIDFGIAKATNQRLTEATIYTERNVIVGTPEYMSPEQARLTTQDVDTRTDIYSLGLVLYQLLAGALPFDPRRVRLGGYREIQRMILEEEPPKPSTRLLRLEKDADLVAWNRRTDLRSLSRALQGDLDWIVMKSVDKDRARRYGNASELAQDIERHLRQEPVLAGPPAITYVCRKFVRRNRQAVAAVSLIFLTLVVGLVASLILYGKARANLEEVLRLTAFSHGKQIADATAEAETLWPESSENVPRMEAWLAKARELMGHYDWHREELASLRREALPYDEAQRRRDLAADPDGERIAELESLTRAAERDLEFLRNQGYDGSGVTVLSTRGRPTCYFRREFVVDRALRAVKLRFRVDDGAAFWLDGSPLFRHNLPAGPLRFATLATSSVQDEDRGSYEESPAMEARIEPGTHALAAEVHQWHPKSPDLYFDLELVGLDNEGVERPLIRLGSEWRYLDDGRDPGVGWTGGAMAAAATCPRGPAPLGYGFKGGNGRVREIPRLLGDLRSELAGLQARAAARRSWKFREESLQWRHDTLAGLVESFRTFQATIADVEARLDRARAVQKETIDDHRAEWEAACNAIKSDPRYCGLPLEPQEGLIPLGQDPESRLFEFAQPRTGRPPARDPASGRLVIGEDTGLVFVLLPGSSFRMGAVPPSPEHAGEEPSLEPNVDPNAEKDEGPVRWVTLDAFFISKYEMTQGQWLRFTGENPSHYGTDKSFESYHHDLRHPVENVEWATFVRVLGRLGLLLPTEAQWEYAARGGTSTPWWTGVEKKSLWGNVNLADLCCKRNHAPRTWQFEEELDDGYVAHAPVGTFRPNAFGLHEVAGNVWEMCRDAYGIYELPVRPGDGLREGGNRGDYVFRGGSFTLKAEYCRSSDRDSTFTAKYRIGEIGVRPARAIERHAGGAGTSTTGTEVPYPREPAPEHSDSVSRPLPLPGDAPRPSPAP